MTPRITTLLTASLLALGATACAGDDATSDVPAKAIQEPTLDASKADRLDAVKAAGNLQLGTEVPGAFTSDFQFFGYTFFAGQKGSTIDLEITQKGSSRGLDTTLFLYGEQSQNDWTRLMMDDDDGWGALSKLKNVEFLGNFRRYMVVVGTADGTGRGNFNLKFSCSKGNCALPPTTGASCPGPVIEAMDECVAQSVGDGESVPTAVKGCTDSGLASDFFDVECHVGPFGTPALFCNDGFVHFKDVLYPVCVADIKAEHAAGETTALKPSTVSPEFVQAADASACAVCTIKAEAFTLTNDRETLDTILNTLAQSQQNAQFQWRVRKDLSFGDVRASVDYAAAVVKELDAQDEKDVAIGTLSTSYAPAAGAEEFINIDVFVNFKTKKVLIVTDISGD